LQASHGQNCLAYWIEQPQAVVFSWCRRVTGFRFLGFPVEIGSDDAGL